MQDCKVDTIVARTIHIILTINFIALASGCTAIKELKLKTPTLFGLEQIAANVYVSKDMGFQERKNLLVEIAKAKPRVIRIFGDIKSNPTVYAFTNEEQFRSFGGYGAGRAVNNGFMLLPSTMNSSAISHEWTHEELYTRVGKEGYKKFPMWFHEGLATIVGDLPQHSEAVWNEAYTAGFPIPPLTDLESLKDWSQAFAKYSNPKGLNVVYSTAGHEVRGWYGRAGQEGLLELLSAVRGDGNFYDIYSEY